MDVSYTIPPSGSMSSTVVYNDLYNETNGICFLTSLRINSTMGTHLPTMFSKKYIYTFEEPSINNVPIKINERYVNANSH